ncbi:hypothetical protein AYO38_05630 [bacterium SCGC AG-212-C10]|nr:hypothetical protein AYO38_05630 [bacterium SCGC AG-212-C10]
MAITDRNLTSGMTLVATYKKGEHKLLVLGDETDGLGYQLDGGTIYKSVSAAASAVMKGQAANGWRFWTVEGEQPAVPAAKKTVPAPAKTPKAKVPPKPKTVKGIRRMKVQTGVPEGQVKYFCSACMKSFLSPSGEEPTACPEEHAAQFTDEFAPTESWSQTDD